MSLSLGGKPLLHEICCDTSAALASSYSIVKGIMVSTVLQHQSGIIQLPDSLGSVLTMLHGTSPSLDR